MKKYLYLIKITFNDSLQYASNILFRIAGFVITLLILISLWSFIYKDSESLINGYSFNQMIWYLLLAEMITFGAGSKVATDEVRNNIKSGNIAYQINKPYHYIVFVISKYLADTFIRFTIFSIIAICLGLIFAGGIDGFNIYTLLSGIVIFFLGVLITGLMKILISMLAFWVEDSKPFQNIYGKIVLIFGVLFPLEMFPNIVQKIIRFSPIYGVSSGPASLIINYSFNGFKEVLITQLITILVILLLLFVIYGKGVKKLNVNGG